MRCLPLSVTASAGTTTSASNGRSVGWVRYNTVKAREWLHDHLQENVRSPLLNILFRQGDIKMAETIAALIGAVVGASITASFWFVQHRIEQKDIINNEQRQDKRELVKNIVKHRMDSPKLAIYLNQIPLTFYDDLQAKELYRKIIESTNTNDHDAQYIFLSDLVNHLAKTMNFNSEIRSSDFTRGLR